MIAQDVSLDTTYMATFGDDTKPVTLYEACPYGGWYGTLEDGSRVRVTASRINNPVKESTNMANNRRNTVTAADRRARRAKSTPVIEITESGAAAVEAATNGKVTTTEIKRAAAKQSAKPATAAKKAAKTTNNTKKESTTVKTTTTARKSTPARKTAPAKTVAKSATLSVTKRTAAKPAAAKTAGKAKTVALKAVAAKKNSWYFKFQGTAKAPLVTGCYIANEAIERLENGEKSLTAIFDHADGKKNSILFREADDSAVFNGSLYVMRNALNGSGITEDTPIGVTLSVKSDDEITLSIVAA